MKHWWRVGALLMALGCGSEQTSNDDGGATSGGSSAAGTSGQSGASGAGSGGSGGSNQGARYLRYTIDGSTVDVEPYQVFANETLLDIISHDVAGASPSLRLTVVGWRRSPGTFACADEPLQPDSTTMDHGNRQIGFWHGHLKEGACEIVVTTVTPIDTMSGVATGTFSGTLYPMSDEPPKTITNGSFYVQYEPPSFAAEKARN